MPVDFECPSCMKVLQFPDEAAGRKVQCLKCGEKFRVPTAKEARSKTIGFAEPVECPGCKDQLRRDVKLCPRCLWNFETGKKNVVPVLEKYFRFGELHTLISDLRYYVHRSTSGRWTLTMREFLFFCIPVSRQVYDLGKYRAIGVRYGYGGGRGGGPVYDVYLIHASGYRMRLWTGPSRNDLQWFKDTFCHEAGLRFQVIT